MVDRVTPELLDALCHPKGPVDKPGSNKAKKGSGAAHHSFVKTLKRVGKDQQRSVAPNSAHRVMLAVNGAVSPATPINAPEASRRSVAPSATGADPVRITSDRAETILGSQPRSFRPTPQQGIIARSQGHPTPRRIDGQRSSASIRISPTGAARHPMPARRMTVIRVGVSDRRSRLSTSEIIRQPAVSRSAGMKTPKMARGQLMTAPEAGERTVAAVHEGLSQLFPKRVFRVKAGVSPVPGSPAVRTAVRIREAPLSSSRTHPARGEAAPSRKESPSTSLGQTQEITVPTRVAAQPTVIAERDVTRNPDPGQEEKVAAARTTPLKPSVPSGWRIVPGPVQRDQTMVRSEWTIRAPMVQASAMKMTVTQEGSHLKAELRVPTNLMGWVNASPTALPHHAVHLPEGVHTLEFSLSAEGEGAGVGGGDGRAPGYAPGPGGANRPMPWTGTPADGASEVESSGGVDYRA